MAIVKAQLIKLADPAVLAVLVTVVQVVLVIARLTNVLSGPISGGASNG